MRPMLHLVTPIVWRIPGHGARKLHGFARAEQASRIDLLQAARLTTSTTRRAAYLRHAIDETRHAQIFSRRAGELRGQAFDPPIADTDELFERLGERRFLAFVHRGERRGREQFELYARHFAQRGDARTEAMFAAILVDERRHESYTLALLVELAGGEPAARRELRRAAIWDAWRHWRRAGRWLAQVVFVLAMSVVYLVAAPITALIARAAEPRAERGRRRRWLGAPVPTVSPPPGMTEPARSAAPALPIRPAPPVDRSPEVS